MNCADCFHYEACHRMGKEIPAESCSTFKDRSHIIELPCAMGSTIWIIVTKHMKRPSSVYSFVRRSNLTWINLDRFLSNFGRTVFLTQEEAVRAMKGEPTEASASEASAPAPECVHYPKDGAPMGCDILTERFCDTRGYCKFRKYP